MASTKSTAKTAARRRKPKRNARADTPLTLGQERFAQEFVKSGNATAAYRLAYPQAKESSCASLASTMLRNPKVSTYIAALRANLAKENAIDADRVLKELAAIGFADMGTYIRIDDAGRPILDLRDLPPGATRAISQITQDVVGEAVVRTTLKLHPKTPALDSIAKCLGMLSERLKLDLSDIAGMTDEELAVVAKAMGLAR